MAGSSSIARVRLNVCFIVLGALSVTATVVLLGVAVFLGDLNQDEGWYLYGARLVSRGYLPYVDFASTQGPVVSYVYALAMPLVERWGLVGGRLFSALLGFICSLCAGLLAYRISKERGERPAASRLAGIIAFMLVGINVYQCYFSAIVKTYSLTALLLLLGFLALSSACKGKRCACDETSLISRCGSAGFAFLAGILIGFAGCTRTSALVVVPVVFLGMLIMRIKYGRSAGAQSRAVYPGGETVTWAWFGIGATAVCCVVFMPFLLRAPGAVWFGLVEYHAGRSCDSFIYGLFLKAGSIARLAGAYFIAFAVLICCLLIRFCGLIRNSETGRARGLLLPLLWCSTLFVAIIHIAAPFPYDEYQVMIYPLFAVGTAVLAVNIIKKDELLVVLASAMFMLSVLSAMSSPLAHGWFVHDIDRIWPRVNDEPPLMKLRKVGRLLREISEPGDMLLTQDTYLAVESGLTLPKGLELGPFCYFPDWSRERAERCHVLNREMMLLLLGTSDASVSAFSEYGFAIKAPDISELSRDEQEELWKALLERYGLFRMVDDFGQARTRLGIFLKYRE